MELETFSQLVGLDTLLGQVIIAFIIISLLLFPKSKNGAMSFIANNALPLALLVALGATLSSLYYSDVIGFTPCKLCWYQRIVMFPQVLLLGYAYYKSDNKILDYSLLLSGVGLAIALFHYFGQITGSAFTDCAAGNGYVSCNALYVNEFGYITIPLMSATAFALIIAIIVANKFKK